MGSGYAYGRKEGPLKEFWVRCTECGLEVDLLMPQDQQPDCTCEVNWAYVRSEPSDGITNGEADRA